MRSLIVILIAFLGISACRMRTPESSDLNSTDPLHPLQFIPINKQVGHGDTLSFAIDPSREIDQITAKYHGVYSIKDGDKVNDEGQPYYMDGMYAYGYVKNGNQVRREVAPKKFVDAYETDNWHDLYTGMRGDTLIVEFKHADKYLSRPEMQGVNRKIGFESLQVRYKDPPGLKHTPFVFNANDHDSMSTSAISVSAGGSHKVKIPASKKITRIDIRWGDEKPRKDGVYVPGTAHGAVYINGTRVLSQRNVAAVETQVFSPISNYASAKSGDHEIEVRFSYDDARIHWIKVYHD